MFRHLRLFLTARIGAMAGVSAIVATALASPATAQKSPQDGYDGSTATYEMSGGTTLRRGEKLLDTLAYTVWQRATAKGAGRCTAGACPVTFNGETVFARSSRLIVVSGPEATASPGVIGRIGDAIGRVRDGGAVERRRLERGDSGEDVRRLQEALIRDGARITADGSYGRGTVNAVQDFQRRRGLKADGVAGFATLRELGLSGTSTAGAPGTTTPPGGTTTTPTDRRDPEPRRRLERGDQGEDVRRLQEALVKQGARLTVDGNFGRGTVTALQEYQRRRGIKADGVAGRETLRELAIN